MTRSADLAFVDTNVLVEALYKEASHHVAALAVFERAQDGDLDLCIAPQVCAEFFSVVTDQRRVSSAMNAEEALDAIASYLAMPGMTLLPVPIDVVQRWTELVRRRPVTRGRIYDVQLVATMQGNGVNRIYTFNVRDFESFADLEVIEP